MNKHLKPGVAVDVRGASDEVKEQVMAAFVAAGAKRNKLHWQIDPDCKNYAYWDRSNIAWFTVLPFGKLKLITINQALGRESEVGKNEFCGTEMQPTGWHGEVTYGSRAVFNECVILPDGKISLKFGKDWIIKDFADWIGKGFEFRPLKTEKAKFVERLVLIINDNTTASFTEISGVLYDKGLRFPE